MVESTVLASTIARFGSYEFVKRFKLDCEMFMLVWNSCEISNFDVFLFLFWSVISFEMVGCPFPCTCIQIGISPWIFKFWAKFSVKRIYVYFGIYKTRISFDAVFAWDLQINPNIYCLHKSYLYNSIVPNGNHFYNHFNSIAIIKLSL